MSQDHARYLCRVDEIPDPGSRGFGLREGGIGAELFVVRCGDRVRAYRNHCPHTGAPLEWIPDRFLDLEGELIQCALHGALFRPDTGLCLRGPCVGQRLQPLHLLERDGALWLPDHP